MAKRTIRLLSTFLIFMLIISCCPGFTAQVAAIETPITFTDINLLAALLENGVDSNGDNQLTPSEMAIPTYLYLSDSEIDDLTGLEYATNLLEVDLDHNKITDISKLATLTKLTYLELSNNQISNITALGSLTAMECLYLNDNLITDLTPLSTLTQLTELGLNRNNFSSLTTIGGLTKLVSLDIAGNQISDISALGTLTAMEYIDLSANQISNISSLNGMTKLYGVNLTSNLVSDLSPLDNHADLTILMLNGNNLDLTAGSASMNRINAWKADYVEVYYRNQRRPDDATVVSFSDANLLKSLLGNDNGIDLNGDLQISRGELRWAYMLNLGMSNISNLTGLEYANDLVMLSLDSNNISSLSPLQSMVHLQMLTMSNNKIISLAPLANMKEMMLLMADSNKITSLTPLTGMSNLMILSLADNCISSISSLTPDMFDTTFGPIVILDKNYLNLTPGYAAPNKITQLIAANILVSAASQKTVCTFNVRRTNDFGKLSSGSYTNQSVTIGVTGTGITSKTLTKNGVAQTWPGTTALTASGVYKITVKNLDGVSASFDFTIDKTKPVITAKTAAGTSLSSGAYTKSSVTVGVTDTNYKSKSVKKNGVAITWPSTNTFTTDGVYTITATDKAGNITTMTFTIDKTLPKITLKNASGTVIANGGTARSNVTIYITESNLKTKTIKRNGVTITWPAYSRATVNGSYEITVTDKAGNISKVTFKLAK